MSFRYGSYRYFHFSLPVFRGHGPQRFRRLNQRCGLAVFRIDHNTPAGVTREVFTVLFNRRLVLRSTSDEGLLKDHQVLSLARQPDKGFASVVQLHDGMTPEEALLVLRAVLGIRVDMIEVIRQVNPENSYTSKALPPESFRAG